MEEYGHNVKNRSLILKILFWCSVCKIYFDLSGNVVALLPLLLSANLLGHLLGDLLAHLLGHLDRHLPRHLDALLPRHLGALLLLLLLRHLPAGDSGGLGGPVLILQQ